MAKKIYAVKAGRKTGFFDTWDECKEAVSGFSNAQYKSFKSLEEAKEYLGGTVSNYEKQEENQLQKNDSLLKAVAYVDGSYNNTTGEYSCGIVFQHSGEEREYSKKGTDESLASMRNVAGEIMGAEIAMRICYEESIPELDLYYDYAGIEMWCTGAWKANKEGTKAYKASYDKIKSKVKVNFHKVAAHTGVELNERVDQLAKAALGIH